MKKGGKREKEERKKGRREERKKKGRRKEEERKKKGRRREEEERKKGRRKEERKRSKRTIREVKISYSCIRSIERYIEFVLCFSCTYLVIYEHNILSIHGNFCDPLK